MEFNQAHYLFALGAIDRTPSNNTVEAMVKADWLKYLAQHAEEVTRMAMEEQEGKAQFNIKEDPDG